MRSVFGADGLVSRALSVRVTGIGMPKVGLAVVLAGSLALGGVLCWRWAPETRSVALAAFMPFVSSTLAYM